MTSVEENEFRDLFNNINKKYDLGFVDLKHIEYQSEMTNVSTHLMIRAILRLVEKLYKELHK